MARNQQMANQGTDPNGLTSKQQIIFNSLIYVESLFAHELALIGNRMTWFVVSQSFLFGAYASIATDPSRLERAFKIGGVAEAQPQVGTTTITVLLILTPLLGIAISIAGWLSVHAAGTVLGLLGECRGKLLLQLNDILKSNDLGAIPVIGNKGHRLTFGGASLARTIAWGQVPEWLLPLAMMIVWMVSLLLRFKIQGIFLGSP